MLSIAPGQRFGRLMAVCPDVRRHYWQWKCDCGALIHRRKYEVIRGHIKSCGCFRSEEVRRLKTKHGHRRAVFGNKPRNTREYNAWVNAKTRCYNQKCSKYPSYGGRGIRMCEEWRGSFAAFLRDMGPAPEGKSLGREENDGPYDSSNCRWETAEEQQANTRVTKRYPINGRLLTIAEAGRHFCLNPRALGKRMHRGQSMEYAVERLLHKARPLSP